MVYCAWCANGARHAAPRCDPDKARVARGRGSRVADFGRGRGSRVAGLRPRASPPETGDPARPRQPWRPPAPASAQPVHTRRSAYSARGTVTPPPARSAPGPGSESYRPAPTARLPAAHRVSVPGPVLVHRAGDIRDHFK